MSKIEQNKRLNSVGVKNKLTGKMSILSGFFLNDKGFI